LQVAVLADVAEPKMGSLLSLHTCDEVVEHVKVPFSTGRWLRDSRSFEVVLDRLETVESSSVVELQLGVIAETRRVIIGDGVGIAERFEDELLLV
jgi:hypothetical protein